MKEKEVPQDPSKLDKFTREVCYAVDDKGNYVTTLSTGWDVKTTALGVAWEDIEQRVNDARKAVLEGRSSPVLFFMELRLMDIGILSAYTGFWKWTIKRHLKPEVFRSLSASRLNKYADAFNISVEELKSMKVDEDRI